MHPRAGDHALTARWRAGYIALFTVVLPLALTFWARRLDVLLDLPRLHQPLTGLAIAALGASLALWATAVLWIRGGGLPASAFPPARLVTTGPYALLSHPIYVGAALVAFGVSVATGSAGGLWIVSPVLCAATVAWVFGFERDLTRGRFGTLPAPALRLPAASDAAPTSWHRAATFVLVLLPWLGLFMAVELLGPAPDARSGYMRWEAAIPVVPWTELPYAAAYPLVLFAPFVALRQRHLRDFALDGLWSMAIVFPVYLLVPLVAEQRAVPGDGPLQWLMQAERVLDSPASAFPAYHVVWTLIAARVYDARWPPMRWLLRALVLATAASCLTTGMHAFVDVLAAFAVYALVRQRGVVWNALRRGTERIANSWHERTIGPVRLLNHGIYAGVGAALGVAVAATMAGPAQLSWLLAFTGAAIAGAAAWAQIVEGSPQLLRPYGYFGSVLGVVVLAVVARAAGADGWLLFTAFGVGSTVTQAAGRLRCLVQGCCHGTHAPDGVGIVYTHARSRVVRLSQLGGTPLHPTQLYSIVAVLVTGAMLARLWVVGAPLTFIAGAYFILVGLSRFVEEHYRGEPQTVVVGGLRLYQWLALAFVVGGAALTCITGEAAPAPTLPGWRIVPPLTVLALVTYAAYGMDFPRSARRFSRLV